MSTATKTITERVAAGAVFLDVHDRGWWREDVPNAIDLDTLDLAEGGACVLGQRCPLEVLQDYMRSRGSIDPGWEGYRDHRYVAYADAICRAAGIDPLGNWARDHGFIRSNPGGDGEWGELTAAWSDLILERRKDAADRGELA